VAEKRRGGCGCAIAAMTVLVILLVLIGLFFVRHWWKRTPLPPPSGKDLQVHVLDIGQGDSILITSPEGKHVLVDAGNNGDGKIILDALSRHGVNQIDLFIATHAHADHIGGADEVMKKVKILKVLDSGIRPPSSGSSQNENSNQQRARRRGVTLPTTKSFEDFLKTIDETGAQYIKAEPGQSFDLGGGAVIRVLAPIQPFFTKDELRAGGNEPNANSIVARLDYGDFSMLLTGDAEAQTEDRLIQSGANVSAKILKVGHHGSKYATSERFIRNVKPEVAIISNGMDNRYGHPSQPALDRLKAANTKIYRTDLQGDITIISRGKGYEIKTERTASNEELWVGREPQRDDSSKSGFVAYGEFGPPPKEKEAKAKNQNR
jgi:competence protein ComEC